MPSPEEETRPKRETGQPSEDETRQAPAPPQAQSPVMGYPGYPPAYPNYPNGAYNNQYPYAQAPPATYYGSAFPTQQNTGYQNSPPATGFLRGILTGLIILLIFICLSTIITRIVLNPQIPVFSVTHFSVKDLNTTEPLTAQWTANLTVENPNTKLKAYFNRIQGFLYHQNADDEEELLATTFFQPMYVDTKKTAEIGESLTAGEKNQPAVPGWVTEGIKKERETGTVSFSLRLGVYVTFKTEGWWTRERGLKVFCEKLRVQFVGASQNGAVSLPKPLLCFVYL